MTKLLRIRRLKTWAEDRSFDKGDKGDKPRPQVRSLVELAQIFGVTPAVLSSALAHSPNVPQARYRTQRGHYYEIRPFLKWYRLYVETASS